MSALDDLHDQVHVSARTERSVPNDMVWSLAAEFLNMVASFLSVRLVTAAFSTAEYGQFAGIYGVVGLAVGACASWVQLVVPQAIIRNGESHTRVLRSVFGLLLMSCGVGLVVVVALGGLLLPGVGLAAIAALAAAELVGQAGNGLIVAIAVSSLSFRAAVVLRIVLLAVRMLVFVGLAATERLTLINLGLFLTYGYVATGLASALVIGRRLGLRFRPGRPERNHVHSAVLFAPAILAIASSEDADKTFLVRFDHAADGGLYAIGYRVAKLAMVPYAALVAATHTRFIAQGDGRNEHLRRSLRFSALSLAYSVVAATAMVTMAPTMVGIIGNERFRDASESLRWLSILVVLRGLKVFPYNSLLGLNKQKLRMFVDITGVFVAMLLYLLLIPQYSWVGALIATLVSEFVTVVMSWWFLIVHQHRENNTLMAAIDE